MKEIPKELIETLKDMSKNGAIIYGGTSLALRLKFNNIPLYRLSKDIDIKKINKSENKGTSPSKQFEKLNINEKYFEDHLKEVISEVKKIKNERPSLTQEYILKFKNGEEIIIELYLDYKKNQKEAEEINGLIFSKIEKVFADKLHTFGKLSHTGNLYIGNNIRHLVDLLHIVITYNLNQEELKFFIKEKLEYENSNLPKMKKTPSAEARARVLEDFNNNFKLYVKEYLIEAKEELNIILDNIKEDNIYTRKNFINEDNINLLIEVINEKI